MQTRRISPRAFIANAEPAQLLIPSKVVALVAPDAVVHPRVIQSLAVRTQRGDQIGVIVGHNRFGLYALERLARYHGCDPVLLFNRIQLSRAFTCHQLHRRILTLDEESISRWRALYVLGLLDTFCDESVRYHEAAQLLYGSLGQLKRVARTGLPVLITLSAPQKSGRESFLKLVARAADEYWELSEHTSPQCTPVQLEIPMPPQA